MQSTHCSCCFRTRHSHVLTHVPRGSLWFETRGRCLHVCAAKKKGGKTKKGPGSLMDPPKPAFPYLETDVIVNNLLLIESYRQKLGKPMMEGDISKISKIIWEAPFAILSEDNSDAPIYTYANKAALDLWETSWDTLVGSPSQLTVNESFPDESPESQPKHTKQLAELQEKGHVKEYSSKRVSAAEKKFYITGTLWYMNAPSGNVVGRALLIDKWMWEDGTKGGPGNAAELAAQPVTDEDIAAAEASVLKQADMVRSLKDQGKDNQDEEVKAAVAELLTRKAKLQEFQERLSKAK